MFSGQEKSQYQSAQEVFWGIQKRKDELPEKYKKLFKQLERIKIGRYDTSYSVMMTIAEVYQNNALNAFSTIFRLGFMKGQRAERAKMKKNEA